MSDEEFFKTKFWAFLKKHRYARWFGYLLVVSSVVGSHAYLLAVPGQRVVSKLKYELGIKPSSDKLLIFYHAYLAGRNVIGAKDIWKGWPPDQDTVSSYSEIHKNLSVLNYSGTNFITPDALRSGNNIDRLTLFWLFRSNLEGYLMKQGDCLDCYYRLGESIRILENEIANSSPHRQTLEIYTGIANKEWQKIRETSAFKITGEFLFPGNETVVTPETIRNQLEIAVKTIKGTLNART